jgi:hypothetical protein
MNNSTETKGSPVECNQCDTPMLLVKAKKYPGAWPYVLIVLGVIFTLFFIGPIIGVPMLLLGFYMVTVREVISLCPSCGAYFKVIGIKRKK